MPANKTKGKRGKKAGQKTKLKRRQHVRSNERRRNRLIGGRHGRGR